MDLFLSPFSHVFIVQCPIFQLLPPSSPVRNLDHHPASTPSVLDAPNPVPSDRFHCFKSHFLLVTQPSSALLSAHVSAILLRYRIAWSFRLYPSPTSATFPSRLSHPVAVSCTSFLICHYPSRKREKKRKERKKEGKKEKVLILISHTRVPQITGKALCALPGTQRQKKSGSSNMSCNAAHQRHGKASSGGTPCRPRQ